MGKIKLEKVLYKKACEFAEKTGYTSVDEFVAHLVEKEVSTDDGYSEEDAEKIEKRLQGLGYIS